MKAGFIGAGKVGFSLGKYLKEGGVTVTGYFSRSRESAMEAAGFTDTGYYDNLADIAKDSDTLFITVPDGTIGAVWENLRNLPIKDKNICHYSCHAKPHLTSWSCVTVPYFFLPQILFA